MVDSIDKHAAQLGIWFMLFVSANQTEKALAPRKTSTACGA
ncbi:hypothetical protein EBME_0641 [bacterium endosymbiont of Mortierella elongata FMR23-6]|nr:hypothetical protein EBME_0641 [bacterium endosymbiont of Mortierella elongata FMR23-6]